MAHSEKPYRRNAGVLVFNDDGLALTGERTGEPGKYQLPQGGLDKGEEPLEGALRELYEETGLDLRGREPVHEVEDWLRYEFPPDMDDPKLDKYRGQAQKWFLFHWNGDPDTLDLDIHHREFDRLFWAPIEDVAAQIVPFKRGVYEALVREAQPVIEEYLATQKA
jgi:putative (di)nucleoside polyphosphate hydrolase